MSENSGITSQAVLIVDWMNIKFQLEEAGLSISADEFLKELLKVVASIAPVRKKRIYVPFASPTFAQLVGATDFRMEICSRIKNHGKDRVDNFIESDAIEWANHHPELTDFVIVSRDEDFSSLKRGLEGLLKRVWRIWLGKGPDHLLLIEPPGSYNENLKPVPLENIKICQERLARRVNQWQDILNELGIKLVQDKDIEDRNEVAARKVFRLVAELEPAPFHRLVAFIHKETRKNFSWLTKIEIQALLLTSIDCDLMSSQEQNGSGYPLCQLNHKNQFVEKILRY